MASHHASSSDDEYQSLVQFLYRTPIGLIETDAQGRIELMNPMAAQLLLPLLRQPVLVNLFDALDPLVPSLRSLVADAPEARGALCEALRFAAARVDARQPPRVLSLSLFRSDGGRLTAVLHDATREQRRQLRSVREAAANTDSLTALPNQRALHAHLTRLLAQPFGERGRVAVLYVNCDRFQNINDIAGHAAGDLVLRQVAELLSDTVNAVTGSTGTWSAELQTVPSPLEPQASEACAFVARAGGDEFVVVSRTQAGAPAPDELATAVLESLRRHYQLPGHLIAGSASIGIAIAGPASTTPGDLLYNARLAMVAAKRAGGAQWALFQDDMLQRAHRRSGIENDLRRAVGTGELFVVYQPVVRLLDRRLEAVEALVRWRHPVLGLLSPVEFIPIAEEAGLIVPLGAHVLRSACHQFAHWRRAYGEQAPQLLAVNLSRGQLPAPSLASDIAHVLQETGMRASELQLEVTESLAAQDESVQMRLHELKGLGLTLALDDFGTGYSSLASLYQLPLDLLKIDRSFVSQIESSNHHRVLVEATIRVAQSLSFRTVAEGIETAAQADILSAMGCDKGQGYFFSRPLEADAFEAWMASQRNGVPPADHRSA